MLPLYACIALNVAAGNYDVGHVMSFLLAYLEAAYSLIFGAH